MRRALLIGLLTLAIAGIIVGLYGGALQEGDQYWVLAWIAWAPVGSIILWQRIGQSEDRPMLAEQDESRFARLAALLAQRAPAYGRINHHLDVTYLSPEEAAKRISEW